MQVTRRDALKIVPVAAVAGIVLDARPANAAPAALDLPATYPTQDPSLAKEMVGASHGNDTKVRELLSQYPALVNAAWDWGFGDWETALGAASHTGQREIAQRLIDGGARPDIFSFAMLGHVDVIRAYVAARPGIQRIRGPHGITLLKHAKAGGDAAASVVEYLTQLGDADIAYINETLTEAQIDALSGDYRVEGSADVFVVSKSKSNDVMIKRGATGTPRMLFHQGKQIFHPAGAPTVRIKFESDNGSVRTMIVEDGPISLRATCNAK
ncbi:MAG: hypothetical protein U0640_13975 [Phycisphaerales bacterium]